MALTVHRVNDPKQNLFTNQHWEVIDTISTHSNFQELPMHFFGNRKEQMVRFRVWTYGLPLYVVLQVFHFPELVVWWTKDFSPESMFVVSKKHSQIVLSISKESVLKMLGLNGSRVLDQNIVTLSKDVLAQKFIFTPSHLQLSFVQSFQRTEYITTKLEFPIREDTFHTTIQQILSMYAQIFGLYHDQTISEAFLGFLMYLSEGVMFDRPKLIAESICDQLSKFNTLSSFKYQSFLMYLILDKLLNLFQQFLEPEQLTPYEVISIVHRVSFLRDTSKGFS